MAIDLTLAKGELASGSRTNSTIPAPGGMANGDLLIAVLRVAEVAGVVESVTLPAGWTSIYNVVDPNTRVARSVIAWKRAANEGVNWTWTHASATTQGVVWRLSGAIASGSPLDGTSVLHDNVGNAGATYTAITTTTANSAVLGIRVRRQAATSNSSTLTERYDPASSNIFIQADLRATAGAGSAISNTDSVPNDSSLFLIGIKEQAGGAVVVNPISGRGGTTAQPLVS